MDQETLEAKKRQLDEIMKFAQGKMGEGLKSKYAPPPPEEEIPGVEPETEGLESLEGQTDPEAEEFSPDDIEALLMSE